jgi:hypothetical protein
MFKVYNTIYVTGFLLLWHRRLPRSVQGSTFMAANKYPAQLPVNTQMLAASFVAVQVSDTTAAPCLFYCLLHNYLLKRLQN